MDSALHFCPNPKCEWVGQIGAGNIGIHSAREKRLICHRCRKTFAATTGTPFYRRHHNHQFIGEMLSLLAHGCPLQAIVATYEVDERTVAAWEKSAGGHCQALHQATVQAGQLDLFQVQADEIRVKAQGAILWLASAIAVSTRLWLGGGVQKSRDTSLVFALALQVKACALCRPLLLCFDGFVAYVKAFQHAFRSPCPTGQRGRPSLVAWPNILLGQVVKQYEKRRVVAVQRNLVQGDKQMASTLIAQSQGQGVLNTAFIERLNATFRAKMNSLVRRGRSLARTIEKLEASLYLVGCVYNFCTWHQSLRLPLYLGTSARRRWVQRTPAMAAGLTTRQWTLIELLRCRRLTSKPEHAEQPLKTFPLLQIT